MKNDKDYYTFKVEHENGKQEEYILCHQGLLHIYLSFFNFSSPSSYTSPAMATKPPIGIAHIR